MEKYESEKEKTQKKQKRNYLLLLLVIFAGGALFFTLLFPSSKALPIEEETVFDLPSTGSDPQEKRFVGIENDLIEQEKLSKALLEQQMEMKKLLFDLKNSFKNQETLQV